MRRLALALSLLTACATPRPHAREPRCALGAPVALIPVAHPRPAEKQEVFELADSPALWAPAPPDPELARYRDAVTQKLGAPPSQPSLLERQLRVYGAYPEGARDAANLRKVLGGAGSIGPASCLEVALWKAEDQRFPMLSHPTEFGAFILRRAGRVRVYFATADFVGQKIRPEVMERIAADVAQGWALTAHLHVHPFLFDRKVGDRLWTNPRNVDDVGGAVAPSATDVQFYQSTHAELPLEAGFVTNGLVTGRYPAKAFLQLVAGPPPH